MSKQCLVCGAEVEEEFKYCPYCGKKHPAQSDFDYNKQRNKEWNEKNAERRKEYYRQYNDRRREKLNSNERFRDACLDRYANKIIERIEEIEEVAKWEVTL